MSSKNNVNRGHYTIAGRDRPGDDVPDREREQAKGAHTEEHPKLKQKTAKKQR